MAAIFVARERVVVGGSGREGLLELKTSFDDDEDLPVLSLEGAALSPFSLLFSSSLMAVVERSSELLSSACLVVVTLSSSSFSSFASEEVCVAGVLTEASSREEDCGGESSSTVAFDSLFELAPSFSFCTCIIIIIVISPDYCNLIINMLILHNIIRRD